MINLKEHKNIYENLEMDNNTEVLELIFKDFILDFIKDSEIEIVDVDSWD